jgi:hypothetical protein
VLLNNCSDINVRDIYVLLWRRKETLEPVEQSNGELSNRDMTMTSSSGCGCLVLLLVVTPLEPERCRGIAGVTTVPVAVYFHQPTPYGRMLLLKIDWEKYFFFHRGAHCRYSRVRDGANARRL